MVRFVGEGEKLSEEGATSDRFGLRRRKAVRRRRNFRQVWVEKEKRCQKKAQLQTGLGGEGEKLSEEGATSDRFGWRRRKAVRRRRNFRQVWVEKEKRCQKKAQLQTGLGGEGEKVSEEGATSDRFGLRRRKAVRRRRNFRQDWVEKEKSCQKKTQLQTGLGGEGEKLSEEGATSDRFGLRRRKAVRRKHNFRQVWVEKEKRCQKKAQLQTGLVGRPEKLSEPSFHSDSFLQ